MDEGLGIRKRRNIMKNFIVICLLMLCFMGGKHSAIAAEHLYSTWDSLELDGCASAWLIKRYIDSEAEFRFYPKGEIVAEGIAFDTPDAKYQRTQKQSTFENILVAFKIEDDLLKQLGQFIHEIEINFWAGEPPVEAGQLNEMILKISNENISPQEKLALSFDVFDEWFDGRMKGRI